MKSVSIFTVILSASFCFAVPPAAKDSPEYKRAYELVVQLGSKKYRDREKAAAELVRMGRNAKDALADGKKHPDSEVNTRAAQLLPQALSLDLNFRIDRFMKDADGKLEHDLPMFKEYRKVVGTDENARKLFGAMLTTNGSLLETMEEEPAKLTERVQSRSQELYQELFGNPFGGRIKFNGEVNQPGGLNVAEVCCLLFASASPHYKPSQPDWMMSNLFSQPAFTELLRNEKTGTAHRRVFFNFLEHRMDDNTINQCVWMLSQYKIKEGADVIAKAIKDKKITQLYTKANAMCCVGTIGSKEHLPVFESLLKDDTQVQPFFNKGQQRGEIKVKDVALAMTIHLNGKNPKDFGFTMWQPYPNQLIQYHQLGFSSGEERDAAFKKWDEESKKPAAKKEEPKKEPAKTKDADPKLPPKN